MYQKSTMANKIRIHISFYLSYKIPMYDYPLITKRKVIPLTLVSFEKYSYNHFYICSYGEAILRLMPSSIFKEYMHIQSQKGYVNVLHIFDKWSTPA